MSLRTVLGIFALCTVLVGGTVAITMSAQPEPALHPTGLILVGGEPRKTAVSVYHDDVRGVTCYVAYQYQGIACVLDIALEDQKHMLAYRDGGAR